MRTHLTIKVDVPLGKYQNQPKVFLKRVDAVDLSVRNGFASQGNFIVPMHVDANVNMAGLSFGGTEYKEYTYEIDVNDHEIYTFGITLKLVGGGDKDFGRKIAVVFVIDGAGNSIASLDIDNGVMVRVESVGARIVAEQAFQLDPERHASGVTSYPISGMMETLKNYALSIGQAKPSLPYTDPSDMELAVKINPFYAAAVQSYGYAFLNTTADKSGNLVPLGKTIDAWDTLDKFSVGLKLADAAEEAAQSITSFGAAYMKAMGADIELEDAERIIIKKGNKDITGQRREILSLNTFKHNAKLVRVEQLQSTGESVEKLYKLGELPNNWQWTVRVSDVQLITRNGVIGLMNELANQGKLSEAVIQYMLEQADLLDNIAEQYRLIAYSKMPEAKLDQAMRVFGKNGDKEKEKDKSSESSQDKEKG